MNKLAVKEVSFEIGAATDEGRIGKNNEDAYTVFRAWLQSRRDPTQTQPVQVAVVADGIGGSVAGEQASRLAVRTIQEVMAENAATPISQRLEKAIKQANATIYKVAASEPALKGMGTTVVATAIVDGYLFVAHAGDSRVYLIREGVAHLLTKDHTWAQEAIDAGYLTPEEAARHPNRNVIKRYLGIHNQVEVDHQLMMNLTPASASATPSPQLDRLLLKPGDTVLLCSDGLTDVVNDQEILNVVSKNRPQKAADKLISLANKAGGPDNITVILVHWPTGRPKGLSHLPLIAVANIGLLLLIIGGIYLGLNKLLMAETNKQAQIVSAATETVSNVVVVNTNEFATATPIPTSSPLIPAVSTATRPISTPAKQTAVEESSPTSTLMIPTETPTPSQILLVPATIEATVPIISAQPGAISVTLISPENGTSGGGEQIFRWEIKSGSLEEEQAFELIFWKEGQDPLNDGFGLATPTITTEVRVNLNRLDDSSGTPLQPGDYNWGIRLVQLNPYQPLQYLGSHHQFRFSR